MYISYLIIVNDIEDCQKLQLKIGNDKEIFDLSSLIYSKTSNHLLSINKDEIKMFSLLVKKQKRNENQILKEIFETILLNHKSYIGESEVKFLEQHAIINQKKKKSINKSIDVPKLKSLDNSSLNESMNTRKSFPKKTRTIKKK